MCFMVSGVLYFFFFSSRRRHTRYWRDWSSDVCSSDLFPVIRRYFDVITGKLKAEKWALGCLIGNLSLEVSAESKPLWTHLSNIFVEWREPFAACIAEAQAAGEIADNFPARDLADFLLAGWHGAMLRMKVDRSSKPLDQFKAIAFATVLARRP